jgi:hypothetical protein
MIIMVVIVPDGDKAGQGAGRDGYRFPNGNGSWRDLPVNTERRTPDGTSRREEPVRDEMKR